MENGVVVLWHHYHPRGRSNFYRLQFEYFKRWLEKWKDEFGTLHLVDSEWNFSTDDLKDLDRIMGERYKIWPFGDGHQWTHFRRIVPQLTEENIMLLDNDFFLYKQGLIKKAFDQLNSGKKVVSMFDGSGGMGEVLWERFPYLKEKGYRRLSPPCMFIKRELLLDVNFDPMNYEPGTFIPELNYTTKEGDWLDAFGEAMVKVLSKVNEDEVEFIPNDFSSLFLYEDGSINIDKREEYDCGYYHLRNSSWGFSIVNERKGGTFPDSAYQQRFKIMPISEGIRLLAWAWVLGESNEEFKNGIMEVVKDFKVSEEKWFDYLTQFKEFHNWII